MGAFKVTIYPKFNPNSANDIGHYRQGIHTLLTELTTNLISVDPADKATLASIQKLINDLEKKEGFFDDKHMDIQRHPREWSGTSRIGKSAIVVDPDTDKEPCTYEELNEALFQCLKKLPRFNSIARKKRKEINTALDELQQWHTDVTRAYVERLRNRTAANLKQELTDLTSIVKKPELSKQVEDFKQQIDAITALTNHDLRTSTACLEQTQKVNTLRNQLLEFYKEGKDAHDHECLGEHLAKQLSVVTKRWIDPYYENPLELTKLEKARKIGKIIIINLAEILAVTAFILFFVAPPASFPVGVAASIGMIPVFDGIFEIARNLWYGRSPTTAQIREVGIAVGIIITLGFCAYGLGLMGSFLVQAAPQVAVKMMQISNFVATTLMRFIDVVLNTVGSLFDAVMFKQGFLKPKTKEDLAKCAPLDVKSTTKIFHDEVPSTDLNQKLAAILCPSTIKQQLEKSHQDKQDGNLSASEQESPTKLYIWERKEGKGFRYSPATSVHGLFPKTQKVELEDGSNQTAYLVNVSISQR